MRNILFLINMLMLLVVSLWAVAVHATDSSDLTIHSPGTVNLRYEPIQPLTLPNDLDVRKVKLGRRLFHEKRLSRDNDMACNKCHDLSENGANHLSHSIGRNNLKLDVNTQTVFNSSLNHALFWDGRARSLEQQINFVVESKKEFATSWPVIISKLVKIENYVDSFNAIYTEGITAASIRNAIATFERSLVTVNSPFDRYLLGDVDAINENEKKGYRLFKTYGCVACHQGSNVGGNLFMKFGLFGDYISDRGNQVDADLGRFKVTGKERDRYVFRVPSLRLVTLTAPYFHDGSVEKLEDAVKLVAKYQLGRGVSDADTACIVAFLKTLVGEYQNKILGSGTRRTDENTCSSP